MSEAQLSKIEAERASLEEEVKKLEDAWTPEKAAEEIIAYVRSSGDKVGNGVLDPFQNPVCS